MSYSTVRCISEISQLKKYHKVFCLDGLDSIKPQWQEGSKNDAQEKLNDSYESSSMNKS